MNQENNFIPSQEPYKKLSPFHLFVKSNFPFIENTYEALDNYGLYCKVVEYLNNVIANENTVESNVTELYNAFVNLNNYVDDYFENLDVQEEINVKLDDMVQNGELTDIFTNLYNSLQNQIDALASGSPIPVSSVDEMVNTNKIYINTTNGYWYYYNTDSTQWVQGGVYQATQIADNSIGSTKLKNDILKSQDMKYLLTRYNMKTCKEFVSTYMAMNSQGVISESNGKNRIVSFDYFNFTKNPLFKPYTNSDFYYFVNIYRQVDKAENTFDFTDLSLELGSISRTNGYDQPAFYTIRTPDYYTVENDTLFEPDFNNYNTFIFRYDISDNSYVDRIEVNDINRNYTLTSEYKYRFVFKLSTNTGGDISSNLNYFINSIKNSIVTEFVGQTATGWQQLTGTYKNNSTYLYKICGKLTAAGTGLFPSDDSLKNYILVSDDLLTPLQNKNISILGDSYSAYAGTIPEGNQAYYTGSNAGVSNQYQMWWSRIINNNAANVEIINGYSGSYVSSVGGQNYCMSETSRCENLGNPDVIIILGGTNDFSHTPALLGTYDGTSNFPSTNNNFSDAYALMLSRITQTYPNATVFCCSIPLFVRTNTNKNQPEQNTELDNSHKTIYDYSNKIKQIAEIFNCQYIDINKCGFNRENYYPTYCQDNSTTPTHPNAKGHEVIAKVVEKEVIDVMNNLK